MSGNSAREVLRINLAQVTLECVVYGGYAALFGMSMQVLMHSKSTHRSIWDFWTVIALFTLATTVTLCDLLEVATSFYHFFDLGGLTASMSEVETTNLESAMQVIVQTGYIVSNAIADFVLIRRCYIVWDSRKRVIAFPAFVSMMNNLLGLASIPVICFIFFANPPMEKLLAVLDPYSNMNTAFMAINVFTNIVLTALIAGRIWWIVMQLEKMSLQAINRKQYSSIIAIVVESGLLYPISVIVFEITLQTVPVSPSLYPLVTQMAGIAPTLIIVRVHRGISINTVEELSTFHAREHGGANSGIAFEVGSRENNTSAPFEKDIHEQQV